MKTLLRFVPGRLERYISLMPVANKLWKPALNSGYLHFVVEMMYNNIKAYNDTKSVIDSLFSGIQKNIKTFSDRVDDVFSNKISLVEGSTSLTTGQKEQQNNILGAAKAGEQAKINTSEIEGHKALNKSIEYLIDRG